MPHLIRCPSCGKGVSTDAIRCPHCGRDIQTYMVKDGIKRRQIKKFNKAVDKAYLPIARTIALTIILASFSIAFSFVAWEVWALFDSFRSDYDGHYISSAIVWTIISVVSWGLTITVAIVLGRKSVKKIKKEHGTVKKEFECLKNLYEQEE